MYIKTVYLLSWIICLSACYAPQETHPFLSEMENLLSLRPDSALKEMERIYPPDQFGEDDRSHYYILLTEARSKNGLSLIDSDTLIDLALAQLRKSGSPLLLSKAYLWKGRLWNELGASEQATQTFLKGVDLLKEAKDGAALLAKLYDELGNTYLYGGAYEEALKVFGKEYALDKQAGDYRGLAFSARNIGCTHLFDENADSALLYFDAALRYARQSADSLALCDLLYNNMSVGYEEKGEYEKALSYLNKINHLTDNDNLQKASLLIHFNQLDAASLLLHSLLHSTDLYIQASANGYLSAIESEKGHYREALSRYKIHKEKSDTIYGNNSIRELKKVAHLYAIEKEKIRLEERYAQYRLGFFLSAAFLLFLAIFAAIIRRKKREKEEAVKENRRMRLERELLFRQKENDELLREIVALSNENRRLKEQNGDADESAESQRKVNENKAKIHLLETEIEIRDFKTNSLYEKLVVIGNDACPKVSRDDRVSLYKEMAFLLPKYVRQIRETYPAAKEQDIVILCLTGLGFTSLSIGNILQLSDSAVRQRKHRLKQATD